MSDFQKWSVLAFRAMDDAGRVLMTIEPESTTEAERLDQLKATIRELLTQCVLLNGLCTRRQLDKRFGFGKLDTEALNLQLGQQQAEPVAWTLTETLNKRETTTRGYLWFSNPQNCSWTPLYSAAPQRKPLTIAEVEQILAQHNYEIHGDRARYIVRMTEEAHGIKDAKAPQEPFGYFRAEPFGWTDCAETDDGAVALYEQPDQRKPLTCAWSPEDVDTMPDTFRSACGELWSFIDGGPKENSINFCHGCGGKVVEASDSQEPKP